MPDMASPRLNLSQFAAKLGVTPRRIKYALDMKKFSDKAVEVTDMQNGRKFYQFDYEIAKGEFLAEEKKRNSEPINLELDEALLEIADSEDDDRLIEGDNVDPQQYDLIQRKYKAKKAKVDFLEATGKLVSVDEVKAEAKHVGKLLNDSLMSVPSRLAPVLAGNDDPEEIEQILRTEIKSTLDSINLYTGRGHNQE